MTIKIGDREFATQRPDDLDAKLVAATGCNAAEHRDMLGSGAPFQIASALASFMAGSISTEDLATVISEGDTVAIIEQARALLAPPIAPADQHDEGGQ